MPAPYTLPSGNNTETIQGMFSYVNTNVSAWFGIMILVASFIIPFVALTVRYGKLRAFAVASWFAFLTSIMLTILSLTPQISIAMTFSLVVISLILLWREK